MIFRVCGWAAVAAIAILSLVPGDLRPHLLSVSQLEHFAAYLVAGAVLIMGYSGVRPAVTIASALPIYAAILELLQLWVPGRSARLIDVVAGSLGAWAGVALILVAHSIVAPTGATLRQPASPTGPRNETDKAE
jgi:hypothetical protein